LVNCWLIVGFALEEINLSGRNPTNQFMGFHFQPKTALKVKITGY
jgi:hypothetical protein